MLLMKPLHIVLLLLLVVGLACGGKPTSGTNKPAESHKIGENVTVGKIRWKITEVKDEGKEMKSVISVGDPKSTSGKFLRVTFEIENLDDKAKSFTGLDLIDDKGRKFKDITDGAFFTERELICGLASINPNIIKTCQAVYELPADVTGLAANPGDLALFGGEEALISLQ